MNCTGSFNTNTNRGIDGAKTSREINNISWDSACHHEKSKRPFFTKPSKAEKEGEKRERESVRERERKRDRERERESEED